MSLPTNNGAFIHKGYNCSSMIIPSGQSIPLTPTDSTTVYNAIISKQNITDNTLSTTDKTIVGAINELYSNKADTSDLATVAFSGSYNDLSNTPNVAEIDDSSTANNKAWSASKIGTDLGGKVSKSGDTMTGNLTLAGNELHMGTASSSSNDSGGIVWYFGNGQEKARVWTADSPTTADDGRLNFRCYKSDGTQLSSGKLATNGDLATKVSKSGDTMSGQLSFSNTSRNIQIAAKNLSYVDGAKGNAGMYMLHTYDKDEWGPILCVQNKAGGSWSVGSYNSEDLEFVNFTKANIDSSTNTARCNYRIRPNSGWIGPWNGVTLDMGTNNTTDTWVPVQTGSTWQHRVIPTDYNNRIIGDDNHVASTGAALSSDTGRIGLHWYAQTGKIANQPAQYGFLLTCATAKGAAEQHSIFMEQANGNLYHMGTNGSSSGSPPSYKKIYDSGNLVTSAVSFTRSHASVSYQEGLVCNRFGNVVTFAGYFSCGATIAANTVLYSGLPKPAGGKSIYFTWSGYDFYLHPTDGTIRTNGQIISRTYVGTFTYVCA